MNETTTTYTTIRDVVDAYVRPSLGEFAGELDDDAMSSLAHAVTEYDEHRQGFVVSATDAEFWDAVRSAMGDD